MMSFLGMVCDESLYLSVMKYIIFHYIIILRAQFLNDVWGADGQDAIFLFLLRMAV